VPNFPAPLRASEIARRCDGVLHGEDVAVASVENLRSAGPGALAFHEKGEPGAAGLLLTRAVLPGRPCVVVADPLAAMVRVLAVFPDHDFGPAHVHPTAVVHPGVVLGAGVTVGEGSVLFPNVVVYPGVRIGRRCRVHAGAVLGADGFRFHAAATGLLKVPQVGGVAVGDDVEIGALSTIDRGFLDDTVVGSGCKLDNMVHVAHNVRLGRSVIIAAQTGISGSCTLGDGVILGGQVGVVDHVTIGAGARVGAGSGVHKAIPAGETWLGSPARPIAQTRRIWAAWSFLPDMVRRG
jgi:UDP-3-O-[3-hydroxymyristoyl] glucosamine N-acyltransferase